MEWIFLLMIQKHLFLSARYGKKESLDLLISYLKESEKKKCIKTLFPRIMCIHNQREILDYLIDNYLEYLNAEGMENAFKKLCDWW